MKLWKHFLLLEIPFSPLPFYGDCFLEKRVPLGSLVKVCTRGKDCFPVAVTRILWGFV